MIAITDTAKVRIDSLAAGDTVYARPWSRWDKAAVTHYCLATARVDLLTAEAVTIAAITVDPTAPAGEKVRIDLANGFTVRANGTHLTGGRQVFVPAEDDDLNACTECGEDASGGEGYDGMCGVCADRADRADEDADEDADDAADILAGTVIGNTWADYEHRTMRRTITDTAERLRRIADTVDRAAERLDEVDADYTAAAAEVLHAIMWGTANLNLDSLPHRAADATAARQEAARQEAGGTPAG